MSHFSFGAKCALALLSLSATAYTPVQIPDVMDLDLIVKNATIVSLTRRPASGAPETHARHVGNSR